MPKYVMPEGAERRLAAAAAAGRQHRGLGRRLSGFAPFVGAAGAGAQPGGARTMSTSDVRADEEGGGGGGGGGQVRSG